MNLPSIQSERTFNLFDTPLASDQGVLELEPPKFHHQATPTSPAPALPAAQSGVKATKIVIVDDDSTLVRIVRKCLQAAGYDGLYDTTVPTEAMDLILGHMPDVILLDINMPVLSGLDILKMVRRDRRLKHTAVLILTASGDAATKVKALELGATDFLIKPVDASELVARVRNALVVKSYQDHLERYAERLEAEVRARVAELAESRQEIIFCLARAAEFRDNETGRHIIRVGRFSRIIALGLGFSESDAAALELAAQMHDVGKIGVPDAILNKPSTLTRDEYELMQKHCAYGRTIFEPMPDSDWARFQHHTELGARIMNVRSSPLMQLAARIAYSHHERWDGTGYPLGLAGEAIPIEGRITAVADVFDALSSKRPYKPALPPEECCRIIGEKRGNHFDPKVVDTFFECWTEIKKVQIDLAD